MDDIAALAPRLELREIGDQLEVFVTQQPDDDVRAALSSVFARSQRISIGAAFPSLPEVDFVWVLDHVPAIERLFISGARVATIPNVRCTRLGTYNRISRFAGTYDRVRVLDLRDEFLDWGACQWPDVETLILRPRGNPNTRTEWARPLFASADAFPRLRELRIPEHAGDALMPVVLDSPLLTQLRCLDLTDSVSNAAGQLLHAHADGLLHLDEIWIGSDDWRGSVERLNPGVTYPRGTFEIDDAWRSRLRAKLGKRLRFKKRPSHPDL